MNKCACKGSFLDRLVQPTILMILYKEKLHGFSILKKMQGSGIMDYSCIDPTGLYRTLKKMEAAGLLTSSWDTEDSPRPKRIYEITDAGRDCLRSWSTTLNSYKDSIARLSDSIYEVVCEK